MIVVDASVVAAAFGNDEAEGARTRGRLADGPLVAPELIDLEVASAWRGLVVASKMTMERAAEGLADLADLPMIRTPHGFLMDRIWELRDNITPYDASYVALAELLDVPLLTADRKLTRASGPRCEFELLA